MIRGEINVIRKTSKEHKVWVQLNFALKAVKSTNESQENFKSDKEKEL